MVRARVMFDCAVAECDAGPEATGSAAGLAGMRCGGWGWLRLIRCVDCHGHGVEASWHTLRGGWETSTNTGCDQDCKEWCTSQTFLTRQSRQGQPPPYNAMSALHIDTVTRSTIESVHLINLQITESVLRAAAKVIQQSLSNDCQEWCESPTFPPGQSLQGQSPPP